MEKKIKVIRPLSELQNTKQKLRVCAYCRVSTEQEDQNGSYETQKAYYEEYIKSNPEWELAGIYADKGSGTSTKNRNAFNEMLEDCEDNKIDLIICKSISRFARNTLDTIKIARELKDEGIYIIFEKENINTEKTESELAFNLLASFAQLESESISKNVTQGVRNRFKNGEYSIGTAPYGYKKESKTKLSINEEEAEVVRLIFNMYIDGYSAEKIADYLNENQVDPNRKWYSRGITKNVIRNKIYIGTMVLQKYVSIDTKKTIVNNGHAPTYELENEHPSIISKEDFEKANSILNEKIEKQKLYKTPIKMRTVFSGKLICGDCGYTLDKVKSKSYKNQSHVCTKNGCKKNKTTNNHIKEQFVELRNELVKNYEQLLITNEISNSNSDEHTIEYKEKLNELTRQKEIIYRLKEDKIIDSAIFIEKNNKIDTDIKKVEEEMYTLNFNNVNRERKKLIKCLKKLSETKKVETIFQENEFDAIIDKVYVKGDIITYVIKTGLELEYKNKYKTKVITKYGYRKLNGKYIVDDYEKDAVNYIFSQYIKGRTTLEISNDLSEKGIKTRTGNSTWERSVILRHLKNKNYVGNDIFPRVIDDEKFAKVQEILNARPVARRKTGGKTIDE